MTTQQTKRELLRWLAGLVNDTFNDGDTVTVDGETRTIGDLLDAANQALEPLTTDQQEDLDRSAAVPISADSASVLFGNFAAIEQAVEILHNKGYSSSVEGLNALWHELESLKNLHATAPLLSTIAQQGEALEAARKDVVDLAQSLHWALSTVDIADWESDAYMSPACSLYTLAKSRLNRESIAALISQKVEG